MTPERVVLRDERGEHVCVVTDAAQIARLERAADAGRFIQSRQMKKGRLTLIFRMKAQFVDVKPSNSAEDEASLNERDMKMVAGCEGELNTREVERLLGRGIVLRKRFRVFR